MNKNRYSFNTPSKLGTESQITTNYANSVMSMHQLECSIHEYIDPVNCISTYGALTKHLGIHSQKVENLRKKNCIRKILNLMVLCRYQNIKHFFVMAETLNPCKKNEIRISQNTTQDWFIESLTKKSKITPETALFRSIFNSKKVLHENTTENSPTKSQKVMEIDPNHPNKFKIYSKSSTNIMIHPQQYGPSVEKLKFAIMFLQERSKNKIISQIKQAISRFHQVAWKCEVIDRYYLRIFRRAVQNQRVFISKVKLMFKIRHDSVLETKRRLVRNFLNKAIERRQRVILKSIDIQEEKGQTEEVKRVYVDRDQVVKKLVKNLEDSMLRTFYLWILQAKSSKKAQQFNPNVYKLEISPQPTSCAECGSGEEQILESERRVRALQKIFKVSERYGTSIGFYPIKRHVRMMVILQKCAVKLACAPRISIQRSLWRLNINAFHQA